MPRKNKAAQALGRLGGLARARKLTKQQQREIGIKARAAQIAQRQQAKNEAHGE
jgi:hypothetical protein